MSTTRSLGKDDITVSTEEVPLLVYRTDGSPTIFAGFRTEWASGEQDGIEYEMAAGAGLGSPYLTYSVKLPTGETVVEYVNMIDFFQNRIQSILKEKGVS
jgi:hypothetical protein